MDDFEVEQRAVAHENDHVAYAASASIAAPAITVAEDEALEVVNKHRQGVERKFWSPIVDPERLTLFTAVHFAFVTRGSGETFSDVLNDFRAHFLKVIKVNWLFYVVRGRENKVRNAGQRSVLSFEEKLSNFLFSLKSALNHYRDNHSDMTCGRLRTAPRCIPFQIFQRCDPMVERIVIEILNTFVECLH